MQHWLAFPWIRYVLWLIPGVLAAFYFRGWGMLALYVALTAAVLLLLLVFLLKKNSAVAQLLWGILAFAMLLCFGYWRTTISLEVVAPADATAGVWFASVEEEPAQTARSYRFRASVWDTAGAINKTEALLTVPLTAVTDPPVPGQLLFVKGQLQEVPAPLNPQEFDYKDYLALQGIHYQLFTQAVLPLSKHINTLSALERTALGSRKYLLQVVRRYVTDLQAAGVVSAMVLGHRAGLDRSLRQAYADAGVMHVLAVSGLHVGIVYSFLLFLLRYFQRGLWKRLCWLALCLLVLWIYAWITGLAPSAMRAALMFSVIATGKAIKLKGNIYNSIGFSAFLLLVINPLLIKQVGFQLSYAAVIGIVYLQPRIVRWYQPEHPFLKKLWQLFTVTLAAQLATFPLGLYYFHQFPTYFFISNILAVPLAFFILAATLVLLLLHWLPLLNVLIGWVVMHLAIGLNDWVNLTGQLPASRLLAFINSWDALLLYAGIISLLVLLRRRSFFWVGATFSLLLLLACSGIYRTYQLRNQRQFTIYQVSGHTLLQFVHGQEELLLPIGPLPTEQQLGFHVEPARIAAGVASSPVHQQLPRDFQLPSQSIRGVQLLVWNGITVAVVEGGKPLLLPDEPLEVDVLLLRKSPRLAPEFLQQAFKVRHLVLDASNSRWYRQQFSSAANSLDLPFYVTSDRGAFIISL
ncbi:ComEC/Rec2 family competence protein [Cesiribacter sp. SM1]|uniref:ComEC/Rec2 family competence protein n=1 Tax=Cesiribacter sp. SM1 TaxID=2861196 RepID=UPI001CD7EF77|nr:ComEC/Rec2 family competence protein [Cesiribacter sp. SM1]